jgi:phage recombination protein Bet
MTDTNLTPVTPPNPKPAPLSLVAKFAGRYNVEADKLMATLKATCFKLRDANAVVSNEQMVALLVVADQYGLNPFTKEIFAFEDKHKGVVPVVSVDGWSRMMNDHAQMDGIEFRFSPDHITLPGGKTCPEWCEAVIYRKDRNRPTVVREFLDECYVPPRGGFSGPWQSHTKRMLRHKTEIQCARIAFSFSGIYDEDEANRIIEGTARDVTNETRGKAITDATNVGNLQARLEANSELPPAGNGKPPIEGHVLKGNPTDDPFNDTDAEGAGAGDSTTPAPETTP